MIRDQETLTILASAIIALCLTGAAQAQYPVKAIRIIVAYTPAGTTDILARAIGQKFTEA
jgi:tripartite-type tricarboxylate transporter receptor subunit TctC